MFVNERAQFGVPLLVAITATINIFVTRRLMGPPTMGLKSMRNLKGYM